MTIYGRSEELVSRCDECDLAEPESLASLGGSAPGLCDGTLSVSSKFVLWTFFLLPILVFLVLSYPAQALMSTS